MKIGKIVWMVLIAAAVVGIWWWLRDDPDEGYDWRFHPDTGRERTATVDGIKWHYCVVDGEAVLMKASRCGSQATELTLPSKLEGFPLKAVCGSIFRRDDPLRSLTIPEGVEGLYCNAFSGVKIETLALPSSVTNLPTSSVSGCKELIVSPDNPKYRVVNGMLCSRDGKVLLCGTDGDVTVPDGVERIAGSAFWGRRLVSVAVPASVSEIGELAFGDCGELRKAVLPPTVRNVAAFAFSGCTNLESVVIPSCVTNIAAYAFEGCKRLKEVAIPDGVVEIGHYAFANCENLESVTIPSSVKHIGDKAFSSCWKLKLNMNVQDLSICPGAFAPTNDLTEWRDALSPVERYLRKYGKRKMNE